MGECARMIGSVETSIRILELLQEMNGAQADELIGQLDLSQSSIYNHLATLEEHNLVVRDDGIYRLSLRFLDFGGYARVQKEEFKLAQPVVRKLAERTGEWSNFIVEEEGYGVVVYEETGDHGTQLDRIGTRIPLHSLASGKAILAFLPEQRVTQILEGGLTAETNHTITDAARLRTELETVREQGFAYAKEEYVLGLRAVGVPVRNTRGRVVGALSISGSKSRMRGNWFEEEAPNILLEMANELELQLAYS